MKPSLREKFLGNNRRAWRLLDSGYSRRVTSPSVWRTRLIPFHLQLACEEAYLAGMRFTISAVVAALTLIVATSSVCAQDPVVVNAKTIKVKFENEKVRVLEAELPPGTKEQVHSHPAYVIYVQAGGKVRNYAAEGNTTETELKTGEVLYRDPLTHAAENIGTTTMHLILVEMKTAPPD